MSQLNSDVVRSGVLFKKGSGGGPFGRKNWKPRYFVLTHAKLQYYTHEDGELKGEINIRTCTEDIIQIMPTDSMKTGNSASTIWRIALNCPNRRLLIAAASEIEMNAWVDALVTVFRLNIGDSRRNTLPTSHVQKTTNNYTATIPNSNSASQLYNQKVSININNNTQNNMNIQDVSERRSSYKIRTNKGNSSSINNKNNDIEYYDDNIEYDL